ncbi:MAG: citryl-CoA lyase [Comamonas sp.]|uniref:citryl-CoA lyase n=1 Tax=Comamonas sp. TaxID=34028 RepID=UPI002FC70A7B
MNTSQPLSAEQRLEQATDWWSTSIIDIRPGVINTRGIPIQDLIGKISFPQMIWLMLRGDLPGAEQARLLEATLVAAVDHGPQAPSIAIARMSVTCGLPLNGAMASAINVLDDVHGGAGEQCLMLYQSIAQLLPEGPGPHPEALLDRAVDQGLEAFVAEHGKIIPGFGHRFHPIDPRVAPLLALVNEAAEQGHVAGTYARISRAVERGIQRRTGKALPMNIDGVTAAVYGELGFAPALARGIFILSRSVGILSHAWEQSQQGHRIKGPMPTSIPYRYTGPKADAGDAATVE